MRGKRVEQARRRICCERMRDLNRGCGVIRMGGVLEWINWKYFLLERKR